jgi:hypothetical protein
LTGRNGVGFGASRVEQGPDMDIVNILDTAFAVFVGASLAVSFQTNSIRSLMRKKEDRADRADKIADRKADELKQAYQRSFDEYERRKQNISAGVDARPKFSELIDGSKTSEEYNVTWARNYYKYVTQTYRCSSLYFSMAPDLEFQRILGTLLEIMLAEADFQLCEIGISEDEEMLEWARLREHPRSVAHHSAALRRHNRLHPIVKSRRDYLIERLKHNLKYWEYFNQTKDQNLATQKAKAECPLPGWNMVEVPSNPNRDYFYLSIWNGWMP